MFSRRRFLQSTTTAASVAALSQLGSAGASSDCKPQPTAIASLQSLKDQAQPITPQERTERQEKARELMQQNGIDAVVLMPGTSLRYFTGIEWWPSERMLAMVLPAKGNAFIVCPAFEQGRTQEQLASSGLASGADIRIWQEDESPYQRVAQGLRDSGISGGTIGIEETVRFVFSDAIAKAAAQAKPPGQRKRKARVGRL